MAMVVGLTESVETGSWSAAATDTATLMQLTCYTTWSGFDSRTVRSIDQGKTSRLIEFISPSSTMTFLTYWQSGEIGIQSVSSPCLSMGGFSFSALNIYTPKKSNSNEELVGLR